MNRRGFFGRLAVLGAASALPPWIPKHKAKDGDSWVWHQNGTVVLEDGQIVAIKGGWFKPVGRIWNGNWNGRVKNVSYSTQEGEGK